MANLLTEIRETCRLLEIKPAHNKGQNFLINEKIYDDIIKAANLRSTDIVLEIGPGLGLLTFKLTEKAKRVLAVELDAQLVNYLQMAIAAQALDNLEVYHEDILRFNLKEHIALKTDYKIVANLPYNITSIFLRLFLSGEHKPRELVLMLQKEVAQRIVAQAPDMSLLALSVQYYADAKIVREVKAGNFWPEPKVDSALIKLIVKPGFFSSQLLSIEQTTEEKLFFRLAKIGFSAKRKMLKNNLAGGLKIEAKKVADILEKNNFNPQVRAEDLNLEDWQKVFAALRVFML
jgi:16S rRNA (adenine1518-N6/adenine1519-N6)-dimethyltransferase